MARLRAIAGRRYSLGREMALVAVVLALWQLIRIPLDGDVGTALRHAHAVLDLEQFVHVDVEPAVIALAAGNELGSAIDWAYGNMHLPALFAFMATACLLAPERYPILRTTFVLSFVPAALVIGLYPLAPPRWLSELGLGPAPAQEALTSTIGTFAGNSTAAAASQHFGYAFFIAAASLWLWPRVPAAWALLAYPALVFVVIVGTANHYVLDCIVGALAFVVGAACAAALHRGSATAPTQALTRGALSRIAGITAIAWAVESFDAADAANWRAVLPRAVVFACGILAASDRLPQLRALRSLAQPE
jgi:PAP2 superfamily